MFVVGFCTRKREIKSDVVLVNANHITIGDLIEIAYHGTPRAEDVPVVIEHRGQYMVVA